MKREDLKKLGLTDEQIESIMAEHGKDIETLKASLSAKEQELAAKTTEAEGYKQQIAERDKDIKALKAQAGNSEELNKKLAELQEKYDTDTAALQKKLNEQTLDFATERYFSGIEFASELAKKAAMAEFKAKGFKYENGKFVGADEFITELKKTDPAAFKPEKKEENNEGSNNPNQNQLPFFAAPTNNPSGAGLKNSTPFSFSFTGVRKPPEQK